MHARNYKQKRNQEVTFKSQGANSIGFLPVPPLIFLTKFILRKHFKMTFDILNCNKTRQRDQDQIYFMQIAVRKFLKQLYAVILQNSFKIV